MPSDAHGMCVQSADIDRRILQETKAEQHIHKLLLLGSTYLLELKRCFVM